jgi:hypothetical protein
MDLSETLLNPLSDYLVDSYIILDSQVPYLDLRDG